jgi:peptidoglycan/LPS O-acetylase OafA/YrhL
MKPAETVTRFAFLDAVRAIAALAVVCEHVGEIFPATRHFFLTEFNPGRAGVFAFFIVSGFVIPFSLERSNDLRKFWVNRFFRLYPLYWASLLAAVLIYWLLPRPGVAFWERMPLSGLANLTMLQDLFREPHAVGAYWTLTFELFFYGLLSVLFVLRLSRCTGWALGGFSLFFGAIAVGLLHPGGTTLFYAMFATGTFFFGTWVYRFWSGAVSGRTFWALTVCFLGAVFLAAYNAFAFSKVTLGQGQMPPMPAATGWVAGYALFALFFTLRDARFPKWLLVLGQISYSIYLLQGVLLLFVPEVGPVAGVVLTAVGSPALAWATYRWIEAPAMKVGRRLTGRIMPA